MENKQVMEAVEEMEEVPSKELTAEEKKIIIDVLTNAPLRGSLQTLPKALDQFVTIIRKLS